MQVLAEIKPGQYFGAVDMLFGEYRTASVQAKTHCELLQITMADVMAAIKDFPILQTLARPDEGPFSLALIICLPYSTYIALPISPYLVLQLIMLIKCTF